jgi:hypothetical protein
MAVVSTAFARDNRGVVVLGAELYSGRRNDDLEVDTVVQHIEALRRASGGRLRRVLLAPESNMSHVQQQCRRLTDAYQRAARRAPTEHVEVLVMHDDRSGAGEVGFRTTHVTKPAMVESMRMQLWNHNLRHLRPFVCGGGRVRVPPGVAADVALVTDGEAAMRELLTQLLAFEKHVTTSTHARTGERRVTVAYHGKHGSRTDDLVMALVLAATRAPTAYLNQRHLYARIGTTLYARAQTQTH